MPWNNAPLKLYHGTLQADANAIQAARAVDLTQCYPDKDFDRGFYTTSIQSQAEDFADLRFRKETGRGRNPIRAAVIEFEINRDALGQLETLCFVQPTLHWTDFVTYCRYTQNIGHKPGQTFYDVVWGPVARLNGQPFPYLEQASFHSVNATNLLTFVQVHWGKSDFPMSKVEFSNLSDDLINREFDEYVGRCTTVLRSIFHQSDQTIQNFRDWAQGLPLDRSARLLFTHEHPLYQSAEFLDIDARTKSFESARHDYANLARRLGWIN